MYPEIIDYIDSILHLSKSVFDPVLKKGEAQRKKINPLLPLQFAGGNACVFRINVDGGSYALKCWTLEGVDNIETRYIEIASYLKKNQLPYFVDFEYQKNGIIVGKEIFPIARMQWVEGVDLKTFINNNIKSSSQQLYNLADMFLEMVSQLHKKNISHGDLHHENIMIDNSGQLRLIDYDGMYVPNLRGKNDLPEGLPGYQHPSRGKLNMLHPKSDYFSELVIYLSILGLAENPKYWNSIGSEELLFKETDFIDPSKSLMFSDLKKMSDDVKTLTLVLEEFCLENKLENLKPLEEVVKNKTTTSKAAEPLNPSSSDEEADNIEWEFSGPKETSNEKAVKTKSASDESFWDKLKTKRVSIISKEIDTDKFWDQLGTKQVDKVSDEIDTDKFWDKLGTKQVDKVSDEVDADKFWDKLGSKEHTGEQDIEKSLHEGFWDKLGNKANIIWKKFWAWFTR